MVGTSTIPFQTVTGSSPTQGLGALVLSGLNGGPAATTATGSVGSGQTPPSNSTGAAGGTAVSTGGGGRVGIRWGASVGMGLYLFLVAV